jgi:hypothetical protein
MSSNNPRVVTTTSKGPVTKAYIRLWRLLLAPEKPKKESTEPAELSEG